MNHLFRLERTARHGALAIAVILMAALAIVCGWQVVVRFFFQYSNPWTEGLARAFMLWSVFLGLPTAFYEGAMVGVELFKMAPDRFHRHITNGAAACTVLLLLTVAVFGGQMAQFVMGQTIAGLGISITWIYASVPVGCALSIFAVITRTLSPGATNPQIVEGEYSL